MSLRLRFEADITASQNLRGKLRNVKRIAQEAGQDAFNQIERPLAADLQFVPPEWGNKKRDWQTDTQRNAFFASDGFGGGIPTRRTGAMIAGWTVTFTAVGRGFRIGISNPVDFTRFVVGSLAKQVSRAARFQQRMHKATGWPLATETVQFWLNEAAEIFKDNMRKAFGTVEITTTRQARTSPRRR